MTNGELVELFLSIAASKLTRDEVEERLRAIVKPIQ